MRKHADYIYRNKDDSMRIRVHRRESGRWDYDVFYSSGKIATYSERAGDDFATKRDALAEARYQYGTLRPIVVRGSVTDRAWYEKQKAYRKRVANEGGGSPGPFGAPMAGARKHD